MSFSYAHLRLSVLASAVLVLLAGCAQSADSGTINEASAATANQGQAYVVDDTSDPDILDIAMGSPDHSTLVAAIQAAQLENVVVASGPLTVFAPTNAAFEALPEGALEDLLKPENKQTLANVVTSHASPGKFTMDLLASGNDVYLATGQYVPVEVRDDGTYVNGAKILATVEASNGLVHVVDTVFLVALE